MPDVIRRTWMQIQAQFEGLTPSAKWLIGTLLVLGMLIVGIVVNLVSKPTMVPISQFASTRGDEVMARLQSAGIDAEREGMQIRVPTDRRDEAIMLLVEENMLSEDASAAFDALVGNQTPWATSEQNQRAYNVAKQKVLANIIRNLKGVKSAEVVIDMPVRRGFGDTHVRPSASVAITTSGRGVNPKQMVEAVAGLVTGAVAAMQPTDVRVTIDGHLLRVDSEEHMLPTHMLELVHGLEDRHRRKIEDYLNYIPGVRVAVNVQVTDVAKQHEVKTERDRSEPLRSEETREMSRRSVQDGGAPGVRSNTGVSIEGSGGAGTEETETEERREYGDKPIVLQSETVRSGHSVERINVSVGVPRAYFVQVYKAQNAGAAEPDDTALQPIINAELTKIDKQVEPLIQSGTPGTVASAMVPDDTYLALRPSEPQSAGIGGMLVSGDAGKYGGVGLLALLAVGLMLYMVRKATQQETLPSVEELAGVPPKLPSDEDELVGEAEEHESILAGVELDEGELKSRRVAEQISDMIKANPDEATAILSRWVKRDD